LYLLFLAYCRAKIFIINAEHIKILRFINLIGQVFIQSDVLEVALDMRNQFDAEGDVLRHIDAFNQSLLCDSEGWILSNPMGIRTEREIHAELEGAKIYRRLYQKWI
jgi:tRNA (guanine-N7-)-methyltransferase